MKLTNHSIQRMKERAGVRYNERIKLFKQALLKGKSPMELKDDKLKKYLLSKQHPHKNKVKLYKGYVFVYSMNSKLYTMYELPERFRK